MKKNLSKIMAAILGTTILLAGCAPAASSTTAAGTTAAGTTAAGTTAAAGPSETKKKIGVIQYVQHASLDDSNKGFVDGLAASGYKDGENVEIDQQNAQGDQANLKNISDRFVNNKVDLILAIATPAAQSAANTTKDIPILATAITDFVSAKLVKSNEKPETNVSGTTDLASIPSSLDALLKLVPNVKNLGIMYTSSEVNSEVQVKAAEEYLKTKGITTKVVTISTVNDIQEAAQSLVGKVDAIYVPTDNIISSSMPTLSKVTHENKIPVLVGAESMVEGGGVMSLAVDYYKIGYITGEMAAKVLKGEAKPQDMPIEAQKDYTLVINKGVAEDLGLTIPEDLAKTAKLVN